MPKNDELATELAGAAARRGAAVRKLALGVARRTSRHRATSRPTCSTPSSRTACSSPSATTTPSRSGTRRKSKAFDATSIVANTSLLNTDWYVRQIIRRPVYDYDAAKGPAIYRNQQWTKPTTSPIHMTMDDADSVPAYYPLDKPMSFQRGRHSSATIDPRNLDHGVLQRADLFVLRMIQDAWPQRPIYFARTSGGYARSLGLGDNVLTQGLASKLFIPPAADDGERHGVRPGRRLARSAAQRLALEARVRRTAVGDQHRRLDRPSVGRHSVSLRRDRNGARRGVEAARRSRRAPAKCSTWRSTSRRPCGSRSSFVRRRRSSSRSSATRRRARRCRGITTAARRAGNQVQRTGRPKSTTPAKKTP